MRNSIGTPQQYAHRSEYDRKLAIVRAGIGENELKMAWTEGRAMTLEQAIEYALASETG